MKVDFIFRKALLTAVAFIPLLGHGADIYRWVDDQGRVHMADSVPERYRGAATKLDSKTFEPSARQRTEATDRAAKDRARLAEFDSARQAPLPASGASAAQLRSQPRGSANAGGSECDRLWQEYHESQVCFGPYFLGQGGIRAEAFSKCKEVRNPSQQCGPSKYVPPQ